jgi:hypothetical protein
MKTLLKPKTSSTISFYICPREDINVFQFLELIEKIEMGHMLTDDDIILRRNINSYYTPGTNSVCITVPINIFNILFTNKK